jgi:hypothetical protein
MTENDTSVDNQPGRDAAMFAAVVGSSVQLFVRRLDACASLIKQATNYRESPAKAGVENLAAKSLGAEKRRRLDALIDDFADRVPQAAADMLERLLAGTDQGRRVQPGVERYPLTEEQASAVGRILAERELKSLIVNQFSDFDGDIAAQVYIRTKVIAKTQESRTEVLGAGLLSSVVGAFERLLGGLTRSGLLRHPLGLGGLGSAPFKVIEGLVDTDDVKQYLIDRKVDALLRAGPVEWRERIGSWTRIDIGSLGIDWRDIVESIQRRHAVIHNGGIVDDNYLTRQLPGDRPSVAVGDRLVCDAAYVNARLEAFRALGVVLGLRWAQHFGVRSAEAVLPFLVDDIYMLERQGRWQAAFQLADAAISMRSADDDDVLQVNWWLCRQVLGRTDEKMKAEIEAWQPSSERSMAARAALRHDIADLDRILKKILAQSRSSVTREELVEMPIFAEGIEKSSTIRQLLTGKADRQTASRSRARKPR